MKEFYSVGEISKIFNIPEPTLRYYDSIGLLSPWKTNEKGYRLYSKAQFEIISTISLMRNLGTPIARLKNILNEPTPNGIRNELVTYKSEIDRQIAELTALKQKAEKLDKEIETTCFDEEIKVCKQPAFYMLTDYFGNEDELKIDEIYATNSELSRWAKSAGIISTITPENLILGEFHYYDEYGYMSEEPLSTKNPHFKMIPARRYLTCNMKVCSVEHYEADDVYSKMLKYVKTHGLTIKGPAIERNVLDLYCGNPKNPTMFFKIYIPI